MALWASRMTLKWTGNSGAENILPAWKVLLYFSFERKKENQAVTLQCFGITECACNFYNSAQTPLPHLVDITGRDIWGNKPWAGMWNIPQNEFLIGCCIKHFESPSLWRCGLSDFMDWGGFCCCFRLRGKSCCWSTWWGFHDSFLKMSAKVNPRQSCHGAGETSHLWRESDQPFEKHWTLAITVKRQHGLNCYRKRKKAGAQSEMGMGFRKLPESWLGWCIKLLRARRVQFLKHVAKSLAHPGVSCAPHKTRSW